VAHFYPAHRYLRNAKDHSEIRNFAVIFGVRKRIPGLSYSIIYVIVSLAVLIQY